MRSDSRRSFQTALLTSPKVTPARGTVVREGSWSRLLRELGATALFLYHHMCGYVGGGDY